MVAMAVARLPEPLGSARQQEETHVPTVSPMVLGSRSTGSGKKSKASRWSVGIYLRLNRTDFQHFEIRGWMFVCFLFETSV